MEIIDNFGTKQLLKDILPEAHLVDIRVRLNGKNYWFEGDFLYDLFKNVTFKNEEKGKKRKRKHDGDQGILSPHPTCVLLREKRQATWGLTRANLWHLGVCGGLFFFLSFSTLDPCFGARVLLWCASAFGGEQTVVLHHRLISTVWRLYSASLL